MKPVGFSGVRKGSNCFLRFVLSTGIKLLGIKLFHIWKFKENIEL